MACGTKWWPNSTIRPRCRSCCRRILPRLRYRMDERDERTLTKHIASHAERAAAPQHGMGGEPAMIKRFIIMAIALAIVFGGLYGFNRFRQHAIADFFAKNKPPPAPVEASEAKADAIPRYPSGTG